MRMPAGVTSTDSSSRMNSSACSSESGRGGIRRTSSSEVDERMFVSFFSFVPFTLGSSARGGGGAPGAGGGGGNPGGDPDRPAGGQGFLEPYPAGAVVDHLLHPS